MRLSVLNAAAAALLALSGLAGAASALDVPRPRFGGAPSAPEDIRILANFSRCVADRQTIRARAILGMDYRTDAYRHELRRLAETNWACAPRGVLRFSAVLFASGMAEALLRDRFRPGDLAAHVAIDPARPPIVARDENEVMSLCTVRAAPAEVAALLRSEPASPEEAGALRAIVPHVTSCLEAGRNLSLNRLFLRSILALAAYRLSDYNGWAQAQ